MKKFLLQFVPGLLALLMVAPLWNCREKKVQKEPPAQVIEKPKPAPMLPKELWTFAGLENGNPDQFEYKILAADSTVRDSDLETNLGLYKTITRGRITEDLPIFQLNDPDQTVLLAGGKGFVAGIWAFILIDSDPANVLRVQLEHRAETEGYGAAISGDRFESQFGQQQVSTAPSPFGLMMRDKMVLEGQQMIDGVSGATVSSMAAVILVNNTLELYHAQR